MRITRCPSCKALVSSEVCACGLELALVAKLMRPATPIVWPMDVLAKCSPATRRYLIAQINRAVRSEHGT
jgi:hypothetical protein